MTREEKLDTIARLLSKSMFYGDWEWETPNERTLEMLMRDVGYWEYKDEDDMIARSTVDEDLYQRARKEIPTRPSTNNDTMSEDTEPVKSNGGMSLGEMVFIASLAFAKNMDYETLKYCDYMYGQEELTEDVWEFVEELRTNGSDAFYKKYKEHKLYGK